MKISLKYILFIALVEVGSCTSSNRSDKINEELIGTWILDSASNPSGEYYKATVSNVFRLKNKSDYSHEWRDYDVGTNDTGKYTITINPKRAIATVSFIPNIILSNKDTIRMRYTNFDIVELSPDRLHTVDQTEFIARKGMSAIVFNKHCIYKDASLKTPHKKSLPNLGRLSALTFRFLAKIKIPFACG